MNRLRDPIIAFIIYIVGFLIILILLHFFLSQDDKNTLNYISIIGTYSSIYGILLTYVQIISVRETTEKTEERVKISSKRIQKILSVSDLSKAIKIIHEIQNYLKGNKDEASIIRLKDLKSILIQLQYNSELKNLMSSDSFSSSLADISIHMDNLNNNLIGSKKGSGLDRAKIISDLEKIETQLNEFEGQLKFSKND